MEEKELQEYKQKIKGLSLKELNDIASHINKDKVPEKFNAIQAEIASRTGAPAPEPTVPAKPVAAPESPKSAKPQEAAAAATPAAPSAQPAPAPKVPEPPKPPSISLRKSKAAFAEAKEEAPKPSAGEPRPAAQVSPAPRPQPAPRPVAAPAAPKSALDLLLTACSVIFVLLGVYFLLVPFISVPGANAIRAFLGKIPPHF